MTDFNIFDDRYAEALFYFVGENERIYDDMGQYMIFHDVSLAEYVNEFYLSEFKAYLVAKGWFND